MTPIEAEILGLMKQMNREGQEKLLDHAQLLVSSGKYVANLIRLDWYKEKNKKD